MKALNKVDIKTIIFQECFGLLANFSVIRFSTTTRKYLVINGSLRLFRLAVGVAYSWWPQESSKMDKKLLSMGNCYFIWKITFSNSLAVTQFAKTLAILKCQTGVFLHVYEWPDWQPICQFLRSRAAINQAGRKSASTMNGLIGLRVLAIETACLQIDLEVLRMFYQMLF